MSGHKKSSTVEQKDDDAEADAAAAASGQNIYFNHDGEPIHSSTPDLSGTNFSPDISDDQVSDLSTRADQISPGPVKNPATVILENWHDATFDSMLAAFQGASDFVASSQSDEWLDIATQILNATQTFVQALQTEEELGGWQGKTHDAAKANIEQSLAEPKAIAAGINNLSILADAFTQTIFETKWYFTINDTSYQQALQRWPHFADLVRQGYDSFAQTVMSKVYQPNIQKIADNSPSFTSGQQVTPVPPPAPKTQNGSSSKAPTINVGSPKINFPKEPTGGGASPGGSSGAGAPGGSPGGSSGAGAPGGSSGAGAPGGSSGAGAPNLKKIMSGVPTTGGGPGDPELGSSGGSPSQDGFAVPTLGGSGQGFAVPSASDGQFGSAFSAPQLDTASPGTGSDFATGAGATGTGAGSGAFPGVGLPTVGGAPGDFSGLTGDPTGTGSGTGAGDPFPGVSLPGVGGAPGSLSGLSNPVTRTKTSGTPTDPFTGSGAPTLGDPSDPFAAGSGVPALGDASDPFTGSGAPTGPGGSSGLGALSSLANPASSLAGLGSSATGGGGAPAGAASGTSNAGNQLSSALGPAADALQQATSGHPGGGVPGGIPGLGSDVPGAPHLGGGPGGPGGGAGGGLGRLGLGSPGDGVDSALGAEHTAGPDRTRVGAGAPGQASSGAGGGAPSGGGGGGQRGPAGKEHKTNKTLRSKRHGELIMGEPDAVVPVLGDDGTDTDAEQTPTPATPAPAPRPPVQRTPTPTADPRREQLRTELKL